MPPEKSSDRYIREALELEQAHAFVVTPSGETTTHSSLALGWVRHIQMVTPETGLDDGGEIHFIYQPHGHPSVIEGIIVPDDFEALVEAAKNDATQHTLKFIPYLQETDPDDTVLEPQTIIIPLLGPYGFQRFIQRFTVLFGIFISERFQRQVHDYAVVIDQTSDESDKNLILS